MSRGALTPSSALPLVYFVGAHVGLAAALLILVLDPALPGAYVLHPRMAAVVHLVTIAWISGSILGAFYVVAPLALGMPLPVGRGDWVACGAFFAGTAGMVLHFGNGRYDVMAGAGWLVLSAVVWLAARAARGARRSTAPWPVLLHVLLAFTNMIAAALFGIALGVDRVSGVFGWPPVAAAFAHAHLAAIGWPLMMVVGLAYRLVPMFLPARMPTGAGLALSAVLIEAGLVVLVVGVLRDSLAAPAGALVIAAGLASFVRQMRGAVKQRLPRPPALPRRDWSTWQTHAALLWLIIAATLGIVLTLTAGHNWRLRLMWVYGVAGLVGFIAQIVVGIQGRLVPMYAYYRAMASRRGVPPERAANALPSAAFARPIFIAWSVGVPGLAWGLAGGHRLSIAMAAGVLLGGVTLGLAYLLWLMHQASRPLPSAASVAT